MVEPGKTTAMQKDNPPLGLCARASWRQLPWGVAKYTPDEGMARLLAEELPLPLESYDLIVGRYLNPICKLQLPKKVRKVVDLDDWGYQYRGGFLSGLRSKYAHWLARHQLGRFDGYFFVSQRARDLHPELQAVVLPNIPFNPPAEPFPQADSKTILFVGALWYGPNREGIEHFMTHCWDTIKAAVPNARLLLVGAATPARRAEWERRTDVFAPGFVDDLGKAYAEAAFTIAPIYSGGGTNIKVLESLAYGRGCITTPHCADAFKSDLVRYDALGIAQNDQEFAAMCVDWLRDPALSQSKAQRGGDVLRQSYSEDVFRKRVRYLCEREIARL